MVQWFVSVDPLADERVSQTPYNFLSNNPVNRIDPDGALDEPCCGPGDGYLFANLVTTAFYDVKHSVYNTALRVAGSDYRADYKVENGKEVYQTEFTKQASDNSFSGVLKETANAALDLLIVVPGGSVGGKALANTGKSQTTRAAKSAVSSKTGKFTEPALPNKNIVNENGVSVQHFYKSGDHAPSHMHVSGGGGKTKIGANGKPIKGSSELSNTQQQVINSNKSVIRSAGNKINKYQQYQNYRKNQ